MFGYHGGCRENCARNEVGFYYFSGAGYLGVTLPSLSRVARPRSRTTGRFKATVILIWMFYRFHQAFTRKGFGSKVFCQKVFPLVAASDADQETEAGLQCSVRHVKRILRYGRNPVQYGTTLP